MTAVPHTHPLSFDASQPCHFIRSHLPCVFSLLSVQVMAVALNPVDWKVNTIHQLTAALNSVLSISRSSFHHFSPLCCCSDS